MKHTSYFSSPRRIMTSEFDRLLLAARTLKNWPTAAAIAAGLSSRGYSVSEQVVSNWKRRGLSKEGKLRAAPIIGFRIPWLETGKGSMTEVEPVLGAQQTGSVAYFPERKDPVITEVVEIMNRIDDIGRGMILMSARKIADERRAPSSKPSSST